MDFSLALDNKEPQIALEYLKEREGKLTQKELQDLYDARERQSVQNTKQEQRTKRFALISYAGCGVDLKPSVGLGIGYILWRFWYENQKKTSRAFPWARSVTR